MKTCGSGSPSTRWLLAATILVGIGAFHYDGWSQERQGAMLGKPAPAFQVQGIYGESYSLESFKGHILVMQFGASW